MPQITKINANNIAANVAGSVITTNGTATYWTSVIPATVNQAAQYAWTNSHTFSGVVSFSNSVVDSTGNFGTAGQVLTSAGTGSNVYWATVSAVANQAAQYAWTNTHSFSNTVTLNALSANGTLGTAGQVLTSNGSDTYWSSLSGFDVQTGTLAARPATPAVDTFYVVAGDTSFNNGRSFVYDVATSAWYKIPNRKHRVVNSTSYTITEEFEDYLMFANTAAATVLLPTVPVDGETHRISFIERSNTVTVDGNGLSFYPTGSLSRTFFAGQNPEISGLSATYSASLNRWVIETIYDGSYFGNVFGPASTNSVIANSIPRWVGTYGDNIVGSMITIDGNGNMAGANTITTKNITVSNVATVNVVSANGSNGTAGQVLTSNGSSTYWSSLSGFDVQTGTLAARPAAPTVDTYYVVKGDTSFNNDRAFVYDVATSSWTAVPTRRYEIINSLTTTSYTVTNEFSDYEVYASSANVDITLPAIPVDGEHHTIWFKDKTNKIEIMGNGVLFYNGGTGVAVSGSSGNKYSGIQLIYNSVTTKWDYEFIYDSSLLGNIFGPAATNSVNNNSIARWSGAFGDYIKGSGIIIDNSDNMTGANTITAKNITVSSVATVNVVSANGSNGTAGQVLTSNGSSTYWSNTTDLVVANTGLVANATGLHVNALYINTISSNQSTYLGAYIANAYVRTINGISPNVSSGDVSVSLTEVITGNVGNRPATANNGVVYVVSGDSNSLNDGVTYISNGSAWFEISGFDYAAADVRYVNVSGDTMTGNLTLAGIIANGSIGNAGEMLASNGSSTYWAPTSSFVNTAAQYTWTNTHTFTGLNGSVYVSNGASLYVDTPGDLYLYSGSRLVLEPGVSLRANNTSGTAGQVLTTNGSSTYWSTVNTAVNVDATYAWTNVHQFGTANNLYVYATGRVVSRNGINIEDSLGYIGFSNGAGLSANSSLGNPGEVLTSNGTSPYWSSAAAALNVGSNTQVYFNDSGVTNAVAGMTFDKSSSILTVTNNITTSTLTTNNILANGSIGTAGQVLTTNGSKAYWSTVNTAVNTDATYAWTNSHTFVSLVTFNGYMDVNTAIYANGSLGTAGQVLSSTGTGVYWSDVVGPVYGANAQVYFNDSGVTNAVSGMAFSKATNSLVVANNIITGGLVVNSSISANGSIGSNGQVLTSNGTVSYWSTPTATVNVAATYAWTNNHSFTANITANNIYYTGRSVQQTDALSGLSSVTIDCSLGNMFTHSTGVSTTYTFTNAPASSNGYTMTLQLKPTVAVTFTWPASVKWVTGMAPTINSGKSHLLMFYTSDGGTNWFGSYLLDYTV